MKHLCDLPASVIRKAFTEASWRVCEKLDGSYMKAGYDDHGRFYTQRKGNVVYHSYTDWPDLPWTNYFRSAHLALFNIFELLREHNAVSNGDFLEFEVIAGDTPNSITYTFVMANSLVVIGGTFDLANTVIGPGAVFKFNALNSQFGSFNVSSLMWFSDRGITMVKKTKIVNWHLRKPVDFPFDPKYLMQDRVLSIPQWLDAPTRLATFDLTNGEALELKLNRKPSFISDEHWKSYRPFLIDKMRELRDEKQKQLEILCNLYARIMRNNLQTSVSNVLYRGYVAEGVVVRTHIDGTVVTFKMVDKEYFAPLNNFTHIVRYWLQGGRRPERPCFMSRTADWPVEKRLARLEVLRRRFVSNSYQMIHTTPYGDIRYSTQDLYYRTTLLFAELKERIANGRGSI